MSDVRSLVLENLEIASSAFCDPGEPLRLVVAASGGEDSHALLHLLRELSSAIPLELCVAHLDHGLRPESVKEARFVASLAEEYALPYELGVASNYDGKENLEAWARRERYAFLQHVRRSRDAHAIVTAHHMHDQAETILFRFLTARLARDAHSIAKLDLDRKLIRPMLAVSKGSIQEYAAEYRLRFVHDSSNDDVARTRNRIRHWLIPELEQGYNPNLVRSLCMTAQRFSDDEDMLWADAHRVLGDHLFEHRTLDRDALLRMPRSLQWRVLALFAKEQVGKRADALGYEVLRTCCDHLLSSRGAGARDLGAGVSCRFGKEDEIEFHLTRSMRKTEELEKTFLDVPGKVMRLYDDGSRVKIEASLLDCAESELVIGEARKGVGAPTSSARAYFDAELLSGRPLCVRERSDGDRVRVWKRGSRKLKKLLQENQLDRNLRDRLPLVESGGVILWVPGVARSELAPVSSSSRQLLELSYTRL